MCNKNVILFPGLGSQYNDMAKKLLCVPKCKKIFMYASEIINCDLISLLESEVNNLKAKIMQPLLLTYGIASYIMLKDYLEFKIFLGHSLGELVALTAAGYINFEEALLFSVERGKYYDNALEKGEVAVVIGIEKNALEDIIVKPVDQVDDGRLPRACGSHEGDLLSGLRIQADPIQNFLLRHIAEHHIMKPHIAPQGHQPVRLSGRLRHFPCELSGFLLAFLHSAVFCLPHVFQRHIAFIDLRPLFHQIENPFRAGKGGQQEIGLLGELV